ncbi:MAG: arylsulfatase, partial [Armatimonadetes bacterium]|nr:arylsulfatase [Armatimonadota bacterium]
MRQSRILPVVACLLALAAAGRPAGAQRTSPHPNIVLILADDLGFSDLGCYGSEIRTPHLDRLAAEGVRFTQFYNAARCCPTRASLLTGQYPHRAGVGHMLGDWRPPAYSNGLRESSATIAELLRTARYRNYHVGKWHVGGVGATVGRNHPMNRGFDRAYGTGGGGNFFRATPLYLDREPVSFQRGDYVTDAFTENAVRFLGEHRQSHADRPFFLHLCYTAPHFPLHARAEEIARYQGRYREGWDSLRAHRFARQRELGILDGSWRLSPRDPVAQPWSEVTNRDEWDLRFAVHAAMVDRMDQ